MEKDEQAIKSCPLPSGRDLLANSVEWKSFIEELKRQWKLLWAERIDDKVRAEGISNKDFELLFVDRGTIIVATRKYKMLEFSEILEQYEVPYEVKARQPPNMTQGGWRKFAREKIVPKTGRRKLRSDPQNTCRKQQLKKGGRGWLHSGV